MKHTKRPAKPCTPVRFRPQPPSVGVTAADQVRSTPGEKPTKTLDRTRGLPILRRVVSVAKPDIQAIRRCLGAVALSYSPLLCLKKGQSRRNTQVIVALLPSVATQSAPFSGATRRAEARIAPGGVIARSCRTTTPRSRCLAGSQSWSQQW